MKGGLFFVHSLHFFPHLFKLYQCLLNNFPASFTEERERKKCISSVWDSTTSPPADNAGMGTGTDVSDTHVMLRTHSDTSPTAKDRTQRPIDSHTKCNNSNRKKSGPHTHTHRAPYRDSHSDWATFPTGMGSSLDWKTNITPGGLWIRSTLGISH